MSCKQSSLQEKIFIQLAEIINQPNILYCVKGNSKLANMRKHRGLKISIGKARGILLRSEPGYQTSLLLNFSTNLLS